MEGGPRGGSHDGGGPLWRIKGQGSGWIEGVSSVWVNIGLGQCNTLIITVFVRHGLRKSLYNRLFEWVYVTGVDNPSRQGHYKRGIVFHILGMGMIARCGRYERA